jgi:hypothetical protein
MDENKERNKMIAIKVLNGASTSSVGKEYEGFWGQVIYLLF